MNEELKLTDEQLRLATSRSLPRDCALDAGTAAARDGFLALGTAVESVASDFDETALMKRLASTCVKSPAPPQREWWPLIISGALAAGMLLAIVRITIERQQGGNQVVVAHLPDKVAPTDTTPLITTASLAWNDPLDDEIALAAATIDQFTGASRGFDGSLIDMNDRLEALSRELLGETL